MPTPDPFLQSLRGRYAGTHTVWFEPGEPTDVAPLEAEIVDLEFPGFSEITYRYSFKGKPHIGRMTLVFAKTDLRYQLSWLDSFHGNGSILHFEGLSDPDRALGFSVSGNYPATDTIYWGWRILIEREANGELLLRHFNIPPGEDEVLAVDMRMTLRPAA